MCQLSAQKVKDEGHRTSETLRKRRISHVNTACVSKSRLSIEIQKLSAAGGLCA